MYIPVSNDPFNVIHVNPVSVERSSESWFDHHGLALGNGVKPESLEFPAAIGNLQQCKSSDLSMTAHASEVSDWQYLYKMPPTRARTPLHTFSVVRTISQDPTINRLMENYARNIANVLPALRHSDNPDSTIYFPKAINGASNVSPSLSSMRFSRLRHFKGAYSERESYFDVMARNLRAKAFASLRKALPASCQDRKSLPQHDQSASPYRESVLSAMLTLVTMDVMEGSMSEYWIHLGGIGKMAQHLSSGTKDSRINLQLVTIACFLSTLAKTTATDLPSLPWTGELGSTSNSRTSGYGTGYGLEFTYGITPVLVNYIERIVTLAQHFSYYATNDTPVVPPSLITSCLDLSNDLSDRSIESESLSNFFSGEDSETNLTLLLAKHHIIAFAHALRLYFHTRLLPWSPADMALCADRVASHLVEIEKLKAVAGYDFNSSATIAWPGFVTSCEAVNSTPRQVWRRW
ncbi:hypothetical protein PV08_05120 [Exophiala spinifera]|uniref:Transcription factor domain-containing protein n=1 Tax=Exophiala spinifera TaxID=91928 RepID=A0A0D2BH27_9EURO|nr:uncharacterized protein PV08_05120 [Exophiala spinifera]KIW17925.1 hypothetical protein PV08_05120 [Exophiala spinifera]